MLKRWLLILVYILSNGICLHINGMDPLAFFMPEGLPSYELASAEKEFTEARQRLTEYETTRDNYQTQLQNNYAMIDKLNQEIATLSKTSPQTEDVQINLAIKISELEAINEENTNIFAEFDKITQGIQIQEQIVPELKEKLETKKDKIQKEFEDIIEVAKTHKTQAASEPRPDKPVEKNIENNDKIIIQPALQQTLKGEPEENVTAYCGYYSLWNAYCFSNQLKWSACYSLLNASRLHAYHPSSIRLDRDLFCNMLERMLIEIRQLAYSQQDKQRLEDLNKENPADRYAWVSRNEMRNLGKKFKLPNTIVVELQMLFVHTILSTPLEVAFEDINAATLIQNFTDQKIDRLVIILVTGRQKGHYITILAERKEDGSIELSVADSLPGSLEDIEKTKEIQQELANLEKAQTAKTEEEQITLALKISEEIPQLKEQLENLNRANRILPLYYALKGQWDELTKKYAADLGFSFNEK